ncbi:hypothetical protein PoB_000080300 [Plakobranchus ocellatus]|uniref:Uncharacterized protein n=1 Tax=Plakobranchus ocellatus TaxID=259542 RepID=A0AAV3XVB8_9GAST|nr:hypothetical protein PoB_000080300 [Plakobranchus ocellatus]
MVVMIVVEVEEFAAGTITEYNSSSSNSSAGIFILCSCDGAAHCCSRCTSLSTSIHRVTAEAIWLLMVVRTAAAIFFTHFFHNTVLLSAVVVLKTEDQL